MSKERPDNFKKPGNQASQEQVHTYIHLGKTPAEQGSVDQGERRSLQERKDDEYSPPANRGGAGGVCRGRGGLRGGFGDERRQGTGMDRGWISGLATRVMATLIERPLLNYPVGLAQKN